MPTRVLIIGAAGYVGSAALAACRAKGHAVTAFVRNPAKLPLEIQENPDVSIVKGDATSHTSLVDAIRGQDAVIQAAVYGSNSPWGTSDSEKVIESVVSAIKEVESSQRGRAARLRLWVMSGQVLMDIPGRAGKIEGDGFPIHPEHYRNYAFLQREASDIDWSLLCPGRIESGEPVGSLVVTTDEVGLWHKPWILGNLPFVGLTLNIFYNFWKQRLTAKSIGTFLAENLGPGGNLSRKRVCLLEDPNST